MNESSASREPIEALADEFLERYRRGERPAISQYMRAHPEAASQIEELFPALVMMERARPAMSELAQQAVLAPPGPAPVQLGDFRIIREVGRGGMGVVYEAEQVSLGRRVALKVLPKQLLADSKHRKRFQREARSASRLDHPSCIRVHDFGITEDRLLYLVMEHLAGRTLAEEIMAVGALAPPRAVGIARQVASALEHAHGLGLVHRDLKPDNIFLVPRDDGDPHVPRRSSAHTGRRTSRANTAAPAA